MNVGFLFAFFEDVSRVLRMAFSMKMAKCMFVEYMNDSKLVHFKKTAQRSDQKVKKNEKENYIDCIQM